MLLWYGENNVNIHPLIKTLTRFRNHQEWIPGFLNRISTIICGWVDVNRFLTLLIYIYKVKNFLITENIYTQHKHSGSTHYIIGTRHSDINMLQGYGTIIPSVE